jgi:hypothetical protein
MVSTGIRFNDYLFTEPERLAGWVPPKCASMFVILIRDSNWAPKPFQALCFGEFGNNAQQSWLRYGHARLSSTSEPLFVSVLPMPFSTTAQRCEVVDQLVWAYNPTCQANSVSSGPSELAHKLDRLEKKHEEILLMLANINKMFEPPQPEQPRRQIGFLSQSEPAA